METLNNKTKHMKQILNEWNQFKKTQQLNEICFSKDETKLLIQLIENKNNLNEGMLDSLKKFPDFIKKFNVLKDKLNKKGLEKIVSSLKSKIRKLKSLKILFLASSIVLAIGCDNDFTKIEKATADSVQITKAQGEQSETVKCDPDSLCIININGNGEFSVETSKLDQYTLQGDLNLATGVISKDGSFVSFDELSTQFAKFAEEKQIESGVLFFQPDIERQLASEIEKNINKISDKDKSQTFNNIINNNGKQYHLMSIYIPKKETTSYKASIEELFKLYEQQLIENNIDYDKDELSRLKNQYLTESLTDGLGGFTRGAKFIKDNVIFPAPQVIFMHKTFNTSTMMRHEFMHAISDFEDMSYLYEKIFQKISLEKNQSSFSLVDYYKNANEILKRSNKFEFIGYKKEDIHKYKDALNITLKYFIGLGLVKKEKDKSGEYKFTFTTERDSGELYYGKPNENARHLFDLQKVISDNTIQETFNVVKYFFDNMYVTKDSRLNDNMHFAKYFLSHYIKKIDELGPIINDHNQFNKKYFVDFYVNSIDYSDYNINEDLNKHKLNFIFYLNKLSKKQAKSVKNAIDEIEAELNVHEDHMENQSYKDDKKSHSKNHDESLRNLLTRAFGLAKLYNSSVK